MAGPRGIPTAPKDVIGDDGDLRQMRDALCAGKPVTLTSDGHVYVSPDAASPMTESRRHSSSRNSAMSSNSLGRVTASLQPDGTMPAHRADQNSIILYDPDLRLSEQQHLLIERAISEGAQIRVHNDGRVEPGFRGSSTKAVNAIDAHVDT